MNECLKIRLGTGKLVPKSLPSYPYQISRESDAWPADSTRNKLTRFDWKQNIDHATNQNAFIEVLEHIKSNGPVLFPAAAISLSKILEGDLVYRLKARVKYLIKEVKKQAPARELSVESDILGDGGDGEEAKPALTRPKKNARAQSVSTVR